MALTKRQERTIEALLQHSTYAEAISAAGISKATLFRWLKEEQFLTAYRAAKDRLFESVVHAMQTAATDAITTLHKIIRDPKAPSGVKVRACLGLIEQMLKARLNLEFEDRLKKVEEMIENAAQRKTK